MSIDRLNLMPKRSIKNFQFWMPEIVSVVLVVGIVFVVVSNLGIQLTNSYKAHQLSKLVLANASMDEAIRKAGAASKANKQQRDKLGLIRGLTGNRISWSDILKELSLVTPNGVWLSEFHSVKDDGEQKEKVILIKGEGRSQKLIMSFFESLKKSQNFKGAEFKFSERVPAAEPKVYSFFIEVWLGGA